MYAMVGSYRYRYCYRYRRCAVICVLCAKQVHKWCFPVQQLCVRLWVVSNSLEWVVAQPSEPSSCMALCDSGLARQPMQDQTNGVVRRLHTYR